MYSHMPFNDGDTLWEMCLQILALCEYHRAHYGIIKVTKSYGVSGTLSPIVVKILSWNTWLYMNTCVHKRYKVYYSA